MFQTCFLFTEPTRIIKALLTVIFNLRQIRNIHSIERQLSTHRYFQYLEIRLACCNRSRLGYHCIALCPSTCKDENYSLYVQTGGIRQAVHQSRRRSAEVNRQS